MTLAMNYKFLSRQKKEIMTNAKLKVWKNSFSLNYLHLRVEDYHSPSIEEMESTVKFIENEIEEKRAVLVH